MFALFLVFISTLSPIKGSSASEPIRYFERHKPTFFLLGKPITKVEISFKVQVVRDAPIYFGYTQLMMWDLFRPSAPIRDTNFNPEVFYRLRISETNETTTDLDIAPFEHESNGRAGEESRSWNHIYVHYLHRQTLATHGMSWSVKFRLPYNMDDGASKRLPSRVGAFEIQFGLNNFLPAFFEVNEVIFRIYSGGNSRINPFQGGQELTFREKASSRILLLPFYVQIFHGYGENLLDADDNRWGLRAGIGF